MTTVVLHRRAWMEGRDGHAADCLVAEERAAQIGAQLTSLETEEAELVRELNSPGFRQQRHQAAGEAIADGKEPDDALPDVRGRLKEIAEEKPGLSAAIRVLSERYSSAYGEARNELARELRPQYVELLKPMVSAVVDLLLATQSEADFRLPLMQQDVSFSGGHLQGLSLAGAQPDGSLWLWLRKVNKCYPELKIARLCEKKGIEL